MLSAGLGIVGFSWAASPSCTELETIVLDWLGRMIGLPKCLLPFNDEAAAAAAADAAGISQPITTTGDANNNTVLKSSVGESSMPGTPLPNHHSTHGSHSSHSSHHHTPHSPLDIDDDVLISDRNQSTPLTGGGVILGSASECLLVALLSARGDILRRLKAKHPFVEDGILLSKLVMYTSKLGHSCVEKAGMIAMVKIRLLDHDENYSLRGSTVEMAVKDDRSNGLIPFFVSCTFGTTSCCSFDNLQEIGTFCNREGIYLHVDGAYAGSSLICDEFREYAAGLDLVDSFNFNPNKWLLVNFDCSCLWVRDKYKLTKALSVDPIYLRYKEMDKAIDYRHWGIALSRRFRSLKIWFTLRSYGVEGLQAYIREHVRLAKEFEKYVREDVRFEILGKVTMGLICFRLKGANSLSQNLLFQLNDSGKIHMVPAMLDDKYVIRFCVNAKNASSDDMRAAWLLIKEKADSIFKQIEETELVAMKAAQAAAAAAAANCLFEEEAQDANEITSKMKRLRFGISKMVSDPRICNPKMYKRSATTFRFTSDSGKYLARKCSIVEKSEDEEF